MATKTVKSQIMMTVGIVLVILVLLNIVSVRVFGRLDVTRNGLFSLSDASKQLVRSLDDKVTVRVYFTEDLPDPYGNNRRAVLDELNEYKAYSHGNLQYEFINPEGEKGEQDAQQQGIQPVQVQVVKQDKFEVKRAYMGMVFLYEDRKETLPVIQNLSSIEYDISSTIKRLTTRTQKKVGFLQGQGEPQMSELSGVQQTLSKQYQLVPVDLNKGAAVPSDIAVLVVMAPKLKFTEPQKFQIDQYLMRGGKIAFLLNRVDADLQNRFGRNIDLGLEDMLQTYGLRINPDLVRDERCASISIRQQQFGFNIQSQVPFPYLPIAGGFSKGDPMVKDLQGIVMFFASSVDTTGLAARNLSGEILMRTSKESGRLTGPYFYFDPLQQWKREDFTEDGIPLAALVHGSFRSAYAGKPVPADTSAGALPPTTSPLISSPDTRIVLIGDGDFVRDQFLGNRDNLTFFANMIDYLVDDAGLITIRSKEVAMQPLEPVSDATKSVVKYGDLILPPLLVVGYGLARWRMRRIRTKALETK